MCTLAAWGVSYTHSYFPRRLHLNRSLLLRDIVTLVTYYEFESIPTGLAQAAIRVRVAKKSLLVCSYILPRTNNPFRETLGRASGDPWETRGRPLGDPWEPKGSHREVTLRRQKNTMGGEPQGPTRDPSIVHSY